MSICQYNTKYFDFDKQETKLFECEEKSLDSGFCIFHDKNYDNNKERLNQLNKKIESSVRNKEPLFCIGYNIPDIKIKKKFFALIYFTKAKLENFNFSGSEAEYADFSGTKFDYIDFSETTFNELDFLGSEGFGNSKFSKITILKKANFSESIFHNIDFHESKLFNAQFLGTKVNSVDFGLSEIQNSNFFGTEFHKMTNFVGSKIINTEFTNVKFLGITNFTGSTIQRVQFFNCQFSRIEFDSSIMDIVSFQNSIFDSGVSFVSAEINISNLFKIQFEKNVNFTDCRIKGTIISDTNFNKQITFFNSNFGDNTKFVGTNFQEVTFKDVKFDGITFFIDVIFNNQKKTVFDVKDLAKVSFRNTDLTDVMFSDKIKWGGKDGFTIIDENLLNSKSDRNSIENVIATYRAIKNNYERRYRDEEAEKFLTKEIALKKKYGFEYLEGISQTDVLNQRIEDLVVENNELKERISKNTKVTNDLSSNLEIDFDKIEEKLVWVFGTPRSGSTWLAKDILYKENIRMLDESMIGAHLGTFRLDPGIIWAIINENHHARTTRLLDVSRKEIFFSTEFEESWKESLRRLILSRFNAQFNFKKLDYLIVKAPNESHGSDIIMKCMPKAKLIFLIRDGRDVIDSRQSKFHNPHAGSSSETLEERKFRIIHFAMWWNIMIETTKKAFDAHNSDLRLQVKYENLREKPFDEIKQIYEFLGYNLSDNEIQKIVEAVKFEKIPDKLKGFDKNIRQAKPSGYLENFSKDEIKLMNEIMKFNLKEFGYV